MIKKFPWRYMPLLWYVIIWVAFGFNFSSPDWYTLIAFFYTVIISIGLLIVGLLYSFFRRDWILLLGYLILGGTPVGLYVTVVMLDWWAPF